MRRALGFKLGMQGHLLMQFVGYLEDRGLQWVTAEAALAWATAPDSTTRAWHGIRFGVARRFAAHLRLLDPRCEVPAADALPERHHRLPPHIYTAEQIAALMSEARRQPQMRAAAAETVIGLLAVTGMRSGEAVRLDRGDVDLTAATLTVVSAKGRRSRVLALHPSTVTALTGYLRLRDDTFPAAGARPSLCPAPGAAWATARSTPPSGSWCRQQGWSHHQSREPAAPGRTTCATPRR